MPQYEINYLNEVLPMLKDYLLQKNLFWPVTASAKPSYPKLTLGNVLYFLKRLEAKDAAAAKEMWEKINDVKGKWRTHWEEKLAQELVSRVRQWGEYMEEFSKEFHKHSPYYDGSVRTRVLITLLIDEIGEENLPPEALVLDVLDATLWPHILEGAFMWDEVFADVFPPDEFWFLYGYLTG